MNRRPRSARRTGSLAFGYLPVAIHRTALELEYLSDYLQSVSKYLTSIEEQFMESLDAECASLDLTDEDAQAFIDSHEDEFDKLHCFFPNTIRSSVLVAACTQLEASLVDLCQLIQIDTHVTVATRFEDVKERGVHKAARFLGTNFGVQCSDDPAWKIILYYSSLRNCVAHAAGEVGMMNLRDQPKIRQVIARFATSGVREDDLGRLVLPIEFLEKVICDMRTFWGALAKALEENADIGPVYWP